MNIHCVSAVGINSKMDLSSDKDRYLPLVSAQITNPAVTPSKTAFYVSYGSKAALAMGSAYMDMRKNGNLPYAVQVTLKVKVPTENDLTIRTTQELKNTNTLCIFKMLKPVAELMIACWYGWIETKEGKRIVAKRDKEPVVTLNRMSELVSLYPVFLDYLNQHNQFKHIKHYMFKTWISDTRVVTMLALYDPDVPKHGISCDRLPEHIHPVFPWQMPKKKTNAA